MKLLFTTSLFSFLLACSAFATAPSIELKFDDEHTVYSVPDGKMWLLNFEKTDIRFLSNIFPDEFMPLAPLEDAFKNFDGTNRSLNIFSSIMVKLKHGQSLILYVDEVALVQKIDKMSYFRDCKFFAYDSVYSLINQYNPESERPELLLSALSKVYKQPFTEEKISCKDARIKRIIICGEKTEVFIRKTGEEACGIFCWYHGMNKLDIPILEKEYDERSKKSKEEATSYWLKKTGEK